MYDLLEVCATSCRAAAIHREDSVAKGRHIEVPARATRMPAVLHQLRMRSIIYVDDSGVLLLRVEAKGLDELVVQRCLAVGCRDHPHRDLGHLVVGLGIHRGLQLLDQLARLHRDNPPLTHLLE